MNLVRIAEYHDLASVFHRTKTTALHFLQESFATDQSFDIGR